MTVYPYVNAQGATWKRNAYNEIYSNKLKIFLPLFLLMFIEINIFFYMSVTKEILLEVTKLSTDTHIVNLYIIALHIIITCYTL